MSVTIKIPTPLRKFTDGQREVSASGETVAAVLSAWSEGNEALKQRLYAADGSLRQDLRVFVGADEISTLQGPATTVPDGAIISLLPPVAGA